jgi:hypothetical protein
MKTKNHILFAIFMFVGLTVFGQEAITFGVRAGVNFQNINGKDGSGDQLDNNLITGFHAGVNMEIPVGTDIYFQPGLLYSVKGGEQETTILVERVTNKISISYIELPLNIIFKPVLGSGNMLLGFGPYVAYGIGGKTKAEGASLTFDRDIEFMNDVSLSDFDPEVTYLKALDAGANFIIGYELSNQLSFQLNAQLGLINIYPDYAGEEDDPTWKNTGFGLSIGYRF